METIVKEITTFVIDKIKQVIAVYKKYEEFKTFMKEYLHEHPDEIYNVYATISCPSPPFSVGFNGDMMLNYREEFFKDFIMEI